MVRGPAPRRAAAGIRAPAAPGRAHPALHRLGVPCSGGHGVVARPELRGTRGAGTAIAGLLALGSIALLRARSPLAIPLIWIFSVEGIADFANAFLQARSAAVVTQLGAAYYIPIVIVPAALVAHVMILGLLLRRSA